MVSAKTRRVPDVTGRRWRVYDGDVEILEVLNQPGPLVSTASPAAFEHHPFLSATALEASHEHHLRELLDASTSVDEYLHALTGAGYRVDVVE